MKIMFINNDGGGFADYIELAQGTSVQGLFDQRMRGAKPEPRITLTYPALESSREVAFLVTGAAKRAVLERLLRADPELPAAHLHPVDGTVRLFVDRAAAPA